MPAYTVHEPTESGAGALERFDRIAFVKEGFAWPALFFQALWLIYHRMWWVLVGFIVLAVAIPLGLDAAGGAGAIGFAEFALALLFAIHANDLRRWSLERRGYRMVGAVSGGSRIDCERRFFTGWLSEMRAREPATSAAADAAQGAAATARRLWRREPAKPGLVAIVDYGSGNLHSAGKAFERAAREAGADVAVKVTADPEDVRKALRVVLPGVGAFADCLKGLKAVPGMVEALEESVRRRGAPFLGICVGMQLMADQGLEHGKTRGFGWIPGEVRPIAPRDPALKIPHMGWNTLEVVTPHKLLDGIPLGPDGLHAYFVHSYHLVAADKAHAVATTDYGGPVTAMVARDNLAGTQFHPEKSQKLGLALIANFLRWKP